MRLLPNESIALMPTSDLTGDDLVGLIDDAKSTGKSTISEHEQHQEPYLSRSQFEIELDLIQVQRDALDKREQSIIDAARDSGITWDAIGSYFGISRSGAQKRFTESGREATRRSNERTRERYSIVRIEKDLGGAALHPDEEE